MKTTIYLLIALLSAPLLSLAQTKNDPPPYRYGNGKVYLKLNSSKELMSFPRSDVLHHTEGQPEILSIDQEVAEGAVYLQGAKKTLEASNVILSKGRVLYYAKERIRLRPGFRTEGDALFRAAIFAGEVEENRENSILEENIPQQAITESADFIDENTKEQDVSSSSDVSRLKVFPNPTSDRVALHFPYKGKALYTVQLFNMLGKLLIEHTVNAGNHRLDLGKLTPGTYILKFLDNPNGVVLTQKVVVRP